MPRSLMQSGFLRTLRAIFTVLLVLAAVGAVIGYTWRESERTTAIKRGEALQQANTMVTGLVNSYAEQLNRQILALDQTLEMLAREWEADPRRFNLETLRVRSSLLNGISRDMFLA